MPAIPTFPARCGLAVLSGAAYALAYPPLGWGWLVVPGLAGLLVALRGQRGTQARAIGFAHGMAAYAVGLSWFYHIFGGLVVMLWCVLAAFTALFAEMQGRASRRGIAGAEWFVVPTMDGKRGVPGSTTSMRNYSAFAPAKTRAGCWSAPPPGCCR